MKKKITKTALLIMCIIASICIGCGVAQAATAKTVKVKAPTKLVKKSVGYKSVKLQWSKVSGVNGYVVYRYNSSTKKYDKKCLVTKKNVVIVDKLAQGGAYAFVVKAYKKVDKKNYYSKNSNVVKVVTVPNKVAKLTISNVKDTSVKISWDKPTGANLYYVYSYNIKKNKYTKLLSTTNTNTTIKGLTPGSTYIFVVKSCAQTKDGEYKTEGGLSPKTYAYTAPSVAKGLVQYGLTDTSISIKWNEAKGADGYKIYSYNSSTNKGTLIKKVSASTKKYTQTGLKAGTEYCYAVRSYAKFGDDEVNATSFESRYAITRPDKVTGLKVSDETDNSIKLSWSKVTGAKGYYIYKYDEKSKEYKSIKTTTSTTYKETGLDGFTSYKYMVKAYREYRYNTSHYIGEGTTISARTELGTPSELEVTDISNNSISYKWSSVNNATGYIVTVADTSGNVIETTKVLSDVTSYTYSSKKDEVINVKVTVQPFVTVITINNSDKKEYLGGKISLTSSNVLGKVEGMEQFSCEYDTIGIAWKEVSLAEKYEIYKLSSGSYVKIGESTTCEYIISGLKAGTVCDVKVRAVVNKDGQTLRGDYSDNLECISTYGKVEGEVAEACLKYVKIKWDKVSTADGYKVYKYNASSGAYELKKTIKSASTATYTDTEVSSGNSYTYKIIVYKDIDGLLNESEMGNPIVAKIGVYGVDVSQYQGTIDWDKVKAAGIDYAIIRATRYSSSGTNGTNLVKDTQFDNNMKNAIAAGIKVGVYVYSYADSVAEAKKEAEYVISLVKNYKLTYPIYFDIEDPARKNTSYKTENTNMSIAFCDAVKAAGYKPGVYSGASFFVSYLNISSLSKYDIWVARYLYSDKTFAFPSGISDINKCISMGYTYNNKYTSINADMWQYTSSGTVAGIPGRVDMNYGYKSY